MGTESHSFDFLLEEYKRLLQEYERNEELGQKRMDFFIAISGAVLGVFALKEGGLPAPGTQGEKLLLGGLAALLLFGLLTLARIVHRNLETHKLLRAVGRARAYFFEIDPTIAKYSFFEARDDEPIREWTWRFWERGGLAETVAMVNSLLASGAAALLFRRLGPLNVVHKLLSLSSLVLLFIIIWSLQGLFIRNRYLEGAVKAKKESEFPGESKDAS